MGEEEPVAEMGVFRRRCWPQQSKKCSRCLPAVSSGVCPRQTFAASITTKSTAVASVVASLM